MYDFFPRCEIFSTWMCIILSTQISRFFDIMDVDKEQELYDWDFSFPDRDFLELFQINEFSDLSQCLEYSHLDMHGSQLLTHIPTVPDYTFQDLDILNGFAFSDVLELHFKTGHDAGSTSFEVPATPTPADAPMPTGLEKSTNLVGPAPKSSKRRRIEDYLLEFDGPQPANMERHRRSPFKPEKRKKVGDVRKAGACLRCRLLKRPVSNSVLLNRVVSNI